MSKYDLRDVQQRSMQHMQQEKEHRRSCRLRFAAHAVVEMEATLRRAQQVCVTESDLPAGTRAEH